MLKQKYNRGKWLSCFLIILFLPLTCFAKDLKNNNNITQELQKFSVKTNNSRLIYNPESNGQSLTIYNPEEYPILVQSTVLDEDKKTAAPFFVTPPLFRLNPKEKNIIHIMSNGKVAKPNRESLYWLCLQAIPPEENAEWDKGSKKPQNNQSTLLTQMRIKTCLKILVRPPSLTGTPSDVANQLSWTLKGDKLTVKNPTPFYMSFKSIHIDKQNIPIPNYVAPFSSETFTIDSKIHGNKITWRIITDSGGESQQYQAKLINQ